MPSTTPHGTKRRGDETVEAEQRLSKRFNLLNLEHNGKLWVPASAVQQVAAPAASADTQLGRDSMQVDETKDRVYIHNLDEELASIEAETGEERLVFLPDIEKKLNEIPAHVLRGDDASFQTLGNEMVLYNIPKSLSVPVEKDSVRKAILESRARARENQQQASRDALLHDQPEQADEDVNMDDAMEIG